jgi:hypothetical protein
MVSFYLPGSCHSLGCATAEGAEACRGIKKSVKKNILRISYENSIIPVISGSTNPIIAMNPAAPDGAPPRRISA